MLWYLNKEKVPEAIAYVMAEQANQFPAKQPENQIKPVNQKARLGNTVKTRLSSHQAKSNSYRHIPGQIPIMPQPVYSNHTAL
ncbi:MAG: hypothetical protein R3F02_05935 [Thiolinea sp.]